MATSQSYNRSEDDPHPSIVLDRGHVLTANSIFGGLA